MGQHIRFLVLIAYVQNPPVDAHSDISSRARSLSLAGPSASILFAYKKQRLCRDLHKHRLV